MNSLFDDFFGKKLDKIKDGKMLGRIEKAIVAVENAPNAKEIPNLEKLKGEDKTAYRIKVGDYRIGLHIKGGTAIFNDVGNRKNFYRTFP